MTLNDFRTQEIKWDKANRQMFTAFQASSGDSNGRKLSVQVLDEGKIVDLTGIVLSLAWQTKDKKNYGLDAFRPVDATKGIFEIFYTTEMLSNTGTLRASLVLVDGTGRVESDSFSIMVKDSVVNDSSVQSENSFTALTEALIQINKYQSDIDGIKQGLVDESNQLITTEKAELDALQLDYAERAGTLEETYAPRLTEVTAQLAHNEDYLNQLQNIINHGAIKPYYVENFADFSWTGFYTPQNLTPYVGGNYYMEITGNQGDSFVTVTGGGNIADAGLTQRWASVIMDDQGYWEPYYVQGTDGVNKVNIYPPLKKSITNGELGNLHDLSLGQHYTERGYKALGQHIYLSKPRYAERNKFIKKFKVTDSTHEWVKIGNPFVNFPADANIDKNIDGNRYYGSYTKRKLSYYCSANGTTQGAKWTVTLDNKKGFVETFVGTKQITSTLIVEFYLDGVLQERVTGLGNEVRRLTFPYENAETGEIRIFVENTNDLVEIYINDTTWWVNEKENPDKLIPPHSKVVYIGDSWGTYHDGVMTKELSRLITKDSGTTIDVINHSMGGTTSARGKAWFNEYVIKERPTHVIIQFFVNDYNQGNGSPETTYTAPDGLSYSSKVTRDQWRQNIRDMAELAIAHGIQPIIIAPSSTASIGQAQGLADYNVFLVEGEKK